MFNVISTRKINQFFVYLILIFSPWLLLFITSSLLSHHSFFDSYPCWSDELSYWHEALSLSQKGFDFGYYSINEEIPHFLSFGSHGIGTVSIYGLFGYLFGWHNYSIVIANTCFLSLAFLFLVLLLKPTNRQTLIVLVFSISFSGLILFNSTSMSELLNYSCCIIYFSLLLKCINKYNKPLIISYIVICSLFCFVRIIYIFLFLPLLFIRKDGIKIDKKVLWYLILWVIYSILLYTISIQFVSPYPDSFLSELISHKNSNFFHVLLLHSIENTINFINPLSENIIQVVQRYFYLFILFFTLWKSKIIQSGIKKVNIEFFVVFLILFFILFINIAIYDVFDWRDYRVLSPVLFGSILFLILSEKRFIIYSSFIINSIIITLLIVFPEIFKSFSDVRYKKPAENSLLKELKYSNQPVSKFENTLIVDQFSPNLILNVPAGIGISCAKELTDNLKSKYLFSKKRIQLNTYNIKGYNQFGYLYQKIY